MSVGIMGKDIAGNAKLFLETPIATDEWRASGPSVSAVVWFGCLLPHKYCIVEFVN